MKLTAITQDTTEGYGARTLRRAVSPYPDGVRTLVFDPPPPEVEELLERRKRLGLDIYDEVWEGVYHMTPLPRGRHGWLQTQLTRVLGPYAEAAALVVIGPFNLGDGKDNFRVPDLGLFCEFDPETLYYPTAAIVVEVVSPGDETYDKFDFYAGHEVDEIVVLDPDERRIHMFARVGNEYEPAERSALLDIAASDLEAAIRWN